MITFDEQLDFFKLIGNTLNEKVKCYAIGGNAMMFYRAKNETKDVDLVFMDENELKKFKRALLDIGFEEKSKIIKIFRRYETAENKPEMMVRGDERFDLFLKEIISFKMSESIIGRVKESHEFNNLIIDVVSPEDIILLKCATERDKDRIDALNLIKKFDINWDVIMEESVHQTKIGAYLFPVFLFDFLYELKEDLKADIPIDIINKVRDIGEEMMIKKLKKRG